MSEQVADKLPTVEDVTGGLNGFDEIAIEKAFGKDLGSLSGTMTLRALVFAMERQAGANDKDAYRTAMQKTLIECRDAFDHSDEDDDDDAEGEG